MAREFTSVIGRTDDSWLSDGSRMSRVVQSMDWSRTPLGAMDTWPGGSTVRRRSHPVVAGHLRASVPGVQR
jgi:hypothetical protein